MAKTMRLGAGSALAALRASRRVQVASQVPSPGSAAEVTVSVASSLAPSLGGQLGSSAVRKQERDDEDEENGTEPAATKRAGTDHCDLLVTAAWAL